MIDSLPYVEIDDRRFMVSVTRNSEERVTTISLCSERDSVYGYITDEVLFDRDHAHCNQAWERLIEEAYMAVRL